MVTFNDHPVQTEHIRSPNQMWWNGMMNPCNPRTIGNLDDDPEELTFYGEDPEGQTPLEESDTNVRCSLLNYQTSIMMNSQPIYLTLLILCKSLLVLV